MFIASLLPTAKQWDQLRWQSMHECMKKMWYIYIYI
jgi:hypothetical protein